MINFSILVPTVPSRINSFFPKILTQLLEQTQKYNDIEILGYFDNKVRSVGEKRNDLLNLAQGKFLTFIDDDDRISDDYIDSIMESIHANSDADCIVFDCICTINAGPPRYCKYGIEFEYTLNGDQWRGKPAHTMVYKSSIAKNWLFPTINNGEDVAWVKNVCQEIKKQIRIDKILYFYDYNDRTTETRG